MSILKVDMRIVSISSDFVLLGTLDRHLSQILKSSHSEAVDHNMGNSLFCNLDECNDRG